MNLSRTSSHSSLRNHHHHCNGACSESDVDGIRREDIATSLEHLFNNGKAICIICWLQSWKILEGLALAIALCLQSFFLDYYIIYYSRGAVGWYFLFLIDVMIMVLFIIAIVMAKRHYSSWMMQKQPSAGGGGDPTVSTININTYGSLCPQARTGQQLFGTRLPRTMGVLPLSYISWFLYSIVLVFKIFIFFTNDVLIKMTSGDDTARFGSKLFEVALACTALIFLLWIEVHKNLEDEVHRSWSKTLTDELIGHTTFEIFDLIFFLELVTPDIDPITKQVIHLPHISKPLIYTIVALGSLNVVYPTLGIYQLSKLHKKSQAEETVIRNHPERHIYGTNVFVHFIRLFNVNIPYLFIRIHLAAAYDRSLSIFIVKNVLGIIISLRSLILEYLLWRSHAKAKAKRLSSNANKRTVRIAEPDETTQSIPKSGWDMSMVNETALKSTPKPNGDRPPILRFNNETIEINFTPHRDSRTTDQHEDNLTSDPLRL
ncbi:uncharacterized protein LOC128397646 [Panonychus citri]|uniref:uncharacterized protein LOC128386410 n=1 Tax=Panonychus citri TaxID=50023 RepID=UPI002307E565|nr:uncharacterized protein LOC128386410 [Panonychus citri]XP_053214365.1 uncharacterized protein LOC128397646 [Panonychus citri]XP_053214366.1 uncharacterized protein LOC128397646 [Panonychus citri]